VSYYTFCDRLRHRIFLRYVDENGRRKQRVFSEYPFELFIKGQKEDATSLFGDKLSRIEFKECEEMVDFVKEYKGVTEIFGQTSPAHQFIAKQFPGSIDFDINKFVILNFDIEVRHDNGFPKPEFANDDILTISMKVFGRDQKITLGLKPFKPEREQDIYEHCSDEKDLLTKFVRLWRRIDPDIITGYNIDGFDIPYVVNRMRKVVGEDLAAQLSPFHKETKRVFQETEVGRGDKSYRILGITSFDYFNLYQKFATKRLESYKLDFVAETELKENKTDLSPWGGSLMRLYNEDFNTFVVYNENDVYLVERLDEKLKFIQLAVSITLMTHSRYNEALATVKPWDNMLYNMLLERNIQIPPENFSKDSDGIAGAYVKDPAPGKYRWVVSMDLTSLYPSIVRMYNMSPETLVFEASEKPLDFLERMLSGKVNLEERQLQGLVTAANGAAFRQDEEGVIAHAMSFLFEERKRVKKQMLAEKQKKEALKANGAPETDIEKLENKISQLDALQQALKVVANGGYGSLANQAFRYFNKSIAEGITLTGQMTIRFIGSRINEFLNSKFKTTEKDYVTTSDTDSCYICLDTFVDKILKIPLEQQKEKTSKIIDCLDAFVKKELEPLLVVEYQKLADFVGSKNNRMDMKREAIADVAIFRGKKNYIMQVWDNEGVRFTEPDLKTVGIETARSSTPKMVRDELKRCLNTLLNESNEVLLKEIDTFREVFYNSPLSKIASPRGVSEMDKFRGDSLYVKGTPIHVKGALHYNDMVVRLGLEAKYPLIKEGEKIKFIYLKEPNPIRCTAIGFFDDIPAEFEMERYIDKDTQFEKVFISPLKSFTDLIGWQVKKNSSLEDLWE